MLYMQGSGGVRIVVLESANLEALKAGRPVVVADRSVVIAWTPDQPRLAAELQKTDGDFAAICRLIDESAKWPEAPLRPAHPPQTHLFNRPPRGGSDG